MTRFPGWRGGLLVWPFLLYAFLFMRLAGRARLEITGASVLAGFCAICLAWCLEVFLRLPDMGITSGKALNFRNWPPRERRAFLTAAGIICFMTALCIAGGYLK